MNRKENETKNKIIDIIYKTKKIYENSWTYNKLTKEEKETFNHIFASEELKNNLSGTEKQMIQTLNIIYSAFLAGVGYNGFNWRETEKQPF